MKIRITFKDPDAVYECVREAVTETIPDGLSDDEQQDLIESRSEQAYQDIRKWIRYGEYLTVEIDTEEGTAKVIEA